MGKIECVLKLFTMLALSTLVTSYFTTNNVEASDTGALVWVKTSNPSSWYDEAQGVAVDGTGLYVVGYDQALEEANSRWRIEKRL